jgi:hypothetical protein
MTNLKEEIRKDMKRDAVKLYLVRKRKRIGRIREIGLLQVEPISSSSECSAQVLGKKRPLL